MTYHNRGDFRRKSTGERVDDAVELNDVMAALKARDAEIKSFAEKANAEIKDTGRVANETKSALEGLAAKGTELAERLQAVEQKMSRRTLGQAEKKSLGAQFVESDAFRSIKSNGKARLEVKATISSLTTDAAGSAGDLIVPDRRPGIVTPAQREFTIRDLILPGRTSSNAIEYIKETGFTNAAASVAENPGSDKPESDLKFDVVTSPVRTVAHMMACTKQVLDDAPMLASYIDTRMTWGLKFEEERQLLAGDGLDEDLLGILPQAITFNSTTYSKGSDTEIDTIRRAVLQARVAEYRPTFVVLNPIDWATVETMKDGENRYLFVNVQVGASMQIWRLNVVETTVMPAGEFLVGASMGAQVFDREDAAVEVSTEHKDYFSRNKVAVRAEERLALAVTRPESFVHGWFDLFESPPLND